MYELPTNQIAGMQMTDSRQYDTVAFDVRDNTTMLFFAKTSTGGDIDEYLLLMRTIDDEFNETIDIEINEHRIGDHNPISEARLLGNTLTIILNEPAKALDGASQIVLTYAETPENLASIEAGAFRVLGDALTGGNA
jgi:hypothetical protein